MEGDSLGCKCGKTLIQQDGVLVCPECGLVHAREIPSQAELLQRIITLTTKLKQVRKVLLTNINFENRIVEEIDKTLREVK